MLLSCNQLSPNHLPDFSFRRLRLLFTPPKIVYLTTARSPTFFFSLHTLSLQLKHSKLPYTPLTSTYLIRYNQHKSLHHFYLLQHEKRVKV